MHVFISYSAVDGREFALKLCKELEAGFPPIEVWIDTRNLLPGQDWDTQIAEKIAACSSFLFIMTRDSVDDQSICKLEWTHAIKYKKPIVPLLFHSNIKIPFRLANRQYINFTDDFSAATEQLRQHLAFLLSPNGILLSLKDRLIDARRDLRRASQKNLLPRIEDDINRLEFDIHQLQTSIDNPAVAVNRAEKTIKEGLERERRRGKQAVIVSNVKFINSPPSIPPSYFQDRQEETRIITQFLQNGSLRMMTIIGRSGVGKTALVCRVLKSLEEEHLFQNGKSSQIDGIIYLSAIGSRRISMQNIYSDLCLLLPSSRVKEAQNRLIDAKISIEDKMRLLLDHFTNKHVIVLLDNFEDLIDLSGEINDSELDMCLRAFLSLPQHGIKMIITTRVAPKNILLLQPGRQKILRLDEGLESPFAERILRKMDEDGRVGLKHAPMEVLRKAREYTRGYPRALEALFAVLAADRDTSLVEILEVAEKQLPENVVEALVGEAFNRLDTYSQKVIQALAIYHFPVPPVAINYLLSPYFPTLDITTILNRLINMHFVRKEKGYCYLHPIDRAYALKSLQRADQAAQETTATLPFTRPALLQRAATYFREIRKPREEWKSIEDLAPQLSEFELLCEGEEYDAAAQLLDEIDLDYLLLWSHAHPVLLMREKLEGKIQHKQLQMKQAKSRGTLFAILGNLDKAIAYYHDMLKILEDSNDKRNRIYALNNIANAYRRLSRYTEAIDYSQQALLIARQLADLTSEGDIQVNLGNIYWTLGRYHEALEQLQKALHILQTTHNQRGEGYALGGLGSTYLSIGQIEAATAHYQQALATFRAIHHRQGEAYILESLGRAYLHAGDLDLAISYSIQSITIHNDIHNLRGVGHSAFNLARIYRAKQDLHQALDYAKKARESLENSHVPEAATAQTLVEVINAALEGDKILEIQALLRGAQSPPSSGDLGESRAFLQEALSIAQKIKQPELESEIESRLRAFEAEHLFF